MVVIGLCGRTGSGKSTVGRYFETLGAAYIDTDAVSREVTRAGEPCLDELSRAFGSGILNADGSLDRKKLAEKAMEGGADYNMLNAITHKYILGRTRELIAASGKAYAVVDAPMLFESGFDKECDFVVGVIAPPRLALLRVIKRDNIDIKTVEKRLEKQKTDKFLREKCDFIIENDSGTDELIKKANSIFKIITGVNGH